MSFRAPGYQHPDYIGFLLLNNMISESDNSASFLSSLPKFARFEAVGFKSSLLSNYAKYKCVYLPYREVGVFTLYQECESEEAGDAETLLRAFLEDVIFNVLCLVTEDQRGRHTPGLQQDSQHAPRTRLWLRDHPGGRKSTSLFGKQIRLRDLGEANSLLREQGEPELPGAKVPAEPSRAALLT
jgi:hypothetical protein